MNIFLLIYAAYLSKNKITYQTSTSCVIVFHLFNKIVLGK